MRSNKTLDKVLSILEARVQQLAEERQVQGCCEVSDITTEARLAEATELLYEVRCLIPEPKPTKTNKK